VNVLSGGPVEMQGGEGAVVALADLLSPCPAALLIPE
jgi:hypothetical protein